MSTSAFITRTWFEELPQIKMFSKSFNFVILTAIFVLLQGTFSVVYNMHLYVMCLIKCFQTRSHFRAESNFILIKWQIATGNDYKSKQGAR